MTLPVVFGEDTTPSSSDLDGNLAYLEGLIVNTPAGAQFNFGNLAGTPTDNPALAAALVSATQAPQLRLSNNPVVVAADSSGLVTAGLPAVVAAVVFAGAAASPGWVIAKVDGAGVTSSIAAGVLTITALTVDASTVVLTATKAANPTLTTTVNIVKVKAGASGGGQDINGGSFDSLPDGVDINGGTF